MLNKDCTQSQFVLNKAFNAILRLLYQLINLPRKLTNNSCDFIIGKKRMDLLASEKIIVVGLPFARHSQNHLFYRIPKTIKPLSPEIQKARKYSTGGCIIFTCNTRTLKVNVLLKETVLLPHMSINGTSGVDIYVVDDGIKKWLGCYAPRYYWNHKIEFQMKFDENKKRTFFIYLPLFAEIKAIQISLEETAILFPCETHYKKAPIIIYGSSVTQGCACSRPGLSYTSLLSNIMNREVYNFGFSSGAKGEPEIASLISSLNPAALIMEYDHNASVKELENSHYYFYKIFRDSNPDVPVIMFSRLSGGLSISLEEERLRYKIIEKTYIKASKNGDKNIYCIDGRNILKAELKDEYFADDRHPNDRGMYAIAIELQKHLEKVFN